MDEQKQKNRALELLDSGDFEALESYFESLHPVELVESISEAPALKQPSLIKHITGLDQLTGVFNHGSDLLVQETLSLVDDSRLAAVVRRMELDDAANFLRELNRRKQIAILKRLGAARVKELKTLLAYDQETAGAMMSPHFFSTEINQTAEQVLVTLRSKLQSKDLDEDIDITYAYICDKDKRLIGICSLRVLLSAEPTTPLSKLVLDSVVKVSPETDQEEVAQLIADYDFKCIPVCSEEDDVILGIVTLDDIIDVIEDETTEDILRLAGTEDDDTVGATVKTAIKRRMPWLIASWIGGVGAAALIGTFSSTIEKVVALTFFMPVVFGMGGNIGSQSTTITVRGIATGDLRNFQVIKRLKKEASVGFILGGLFALLLGLAAFTLYGDITLSFVVAVAILFTMTTASSIGSMIPILFQKLRIDPAVASGPLVTTTTDVISIVIYFSIAAIFL